MSKWIDSRLVVDVLEMAIARHCLGEELIAHSDRGVQYASKHYQRLLKEHSVTCSMSRKGNYWEATGDRRPIRRQASPVRWVSGRSDSRWNRISIERLTCSSLLLPASTTPYERSDLRH